MGSDQESLNKRIRETISGLSDEDLSEMLNASAPQYTAFARQIAKEEITERRQGSRTPRKGSLPDPSALEELREQSDRDKRTGCYIEVWSEKNFEGEHLRIEGPVEHQALDFARLNWCNTISSLRVGPTAFLLVYAEQDFNGAMLSFGPGQALADLDELKFNDEIDSIRLVNSMKVFDGVREDTSSSFLVSASEEKRKKSIGAIRSEPVKIFGPYRGNGTQDYDVGDLSRTCAMKRRCASLSPEPAKN